MEVQLLKEKLTNAVLSLYMYFLKIQGFNVTYENRGGKMSGGALLDETVYAIYFAFFFIIVISNLFPQDSKELGYALDLAVSEPEQLVEKIIAQNSDEINITQQLIEGFGLEGSEALVSKIEGNIETSVNRLFNDKNSENAIVDVMIGVAANAMKTIENEGTNTSYPKIGTYLEKYIENYEKAVRTTNEKGSSPKRNEFGIFSKVASTVSDEMPVASEANIVKENTSSTHKRMSPLVQRYLNAANKIGGSKTRGQKRKIVESKRKRGGSMKQKRRSHKRK
jgi:hypothetical protein